MADLKKAMREWLRKKGVHWDELEQKEKPMQELRKKQGAGFWQADIGMNDDNGETEEERRKRKLNK